MISFFFYEKWIFNLFCQNNKTLQERCSEKLYVQYVKLCDLCCPIISTVWVECKQNSSWLLYFSNVVLRGTANSELFKYVFTCSYPLSIWILKVMQQCVCVSCICCVSCCSLMESDFVKKKRKEMMQVCTQYASFYSLFALTELILVCQHQDIDFLKCYIIYCYTRQKVMSLTNSWVHTLSLLFDYVTKFIS